MQNIVVSEVFGKPFVYKFAQPEDINLKVDQDIDEIRKQGFEHLRNSNWQQAADMFEKVLKVVPNDSLTLYGNALALFNLKKVSTADINLSKAIKLLSNSKENNKLLADALVLSAIISANTGQNSQAVEKLKNAVKLSPKNFDANFSLGRAYYGNGDAVNAVVAFKDAVEIQPQNIRARFFLATSLERTDNTEAALKEYREMLKIDPNSIEGNLGIGVLLLKLEGEKSDEGIAALQKVLSLNDRIYEAQITLGKVLLKLKRNEEAQKHLLKASELVTENPEPHYQLALVYKRLGKNAEAKKEMEIVKNIHQRRRGVPNN